MPDGSAVFSDVRELALLQSLAIAGLVGQVGVDISGHMLDALELEHVVGT